MHVAAVQAWLALQVAETCRLQRPDLPCSLLTNPACQGLTCPCRWLTDAITEVSEISGLSEAFLGLIILPIAGNACEHITAVLVAYKVGVRHYCARQPAA